MLCKLNNDYLPKHRKMITFASQLKAGKGLTIVASVLEGTQSNIFIWPSEIIFISHEKNLCSQDSLSSFMLLNAHASCFYVT